MNDNKKRLQQRVINACEGALYKNQYISPIDVFIGMQMLQPNQIEDWRKGTILLPLLFFNLFIIRHVHSVRKKLVQGIFYSMTIVNIYVLIVPICTSWNIFPMELKEIANCLVN